MLGQKEKEEHDQRNQECWAVRARARRHIREWASLERWHLSQDWKVTEWENQAGLWGKDFQAGGTVGANALERDVPVQSEDQQGGQDAE